MPGFWSRKEAAVFLGINIIRDKNPDRWRKAGRGPAFMGFKNEIIQVKDPKAGESRQAFMTETVKEMLLVSLVR